MARGITVKGLETRIAKAEAKVERTKKAYESAKTELKELADQRDELRKKELWDTVAKSKKSYDDIMNFVGSTEKVEEATEENTETTETAE